MADRLAARSEALTMQRHERAVRMGKASILIDGDTKQRQYKLAWMHGPAAPLDLRILMNITGLPQSCW